MPASNSHERVISLSITRIGMVLLACLALNAWAEPIAYVTRPDRNDLGMIDTVSLTVLGGIPTGGRPLVVAIAPDATFGYVGVKGGSTLILDTLASAVSDGQGRPPELPASVHQVAFHPDAPRAYLLADDSLWVLDTNTHTVLDVWLNPSPSLGLFIDIDAGALVSLSDNGDVYAWWLDSGDVSFLGNLDVGYILDAELGGDGRLYVLTGEELVRVAWYLLNAGAEEPTIALTRVEPLPVDQLFDGVTLGLPLQVDPSRADSVLYVGFEGGVAAAQCEVRGEPRNCFAGATGGGQATVTRAVIELFESPNSRGLEGYMSDLRQSRDGTRLYAFGRRMMAAIDTETFSLLTDFNVRSGGGYLGMVDLGYAAAACIADSTSLLALARTATTLDTSAESAQKLVYRAKAARTLMIEGQPEEARLKLQRFIGLAVNRSNLNPGDPHYIKADDAARIICAAANLMVRIVAHQD